MRFPRSIQDKIEKKQLELKNIQQKIDEYEKKKKSKQFEIESLTSVISGFNNNKVGTICYKEVDDKFGLDLTEAGKHISYTTLKKQLNN